ARPLFSDAWNSSNSNVQHCFFHSYLHYNFKAKFFRQTQEGLDTANNTVYAPCATVLSIQLAGLAANFCVFSGSKCSVALTEATDSSTHSSSAKCAFRRS